MQPGHWIILHKKLGKAISGDEVADGDTEGLGERSHFNYYIHFYASTEGTQVSVGDGNIVGS